MRPSTIFTDDVYSYSAWDYEVPEEIKSGHCPCGKNFQRGEGRAFAAHIESCPAAQADRERTAYDARADWEGAR